MGFTYGSFQKSGAIIQAPISYEPYYQDSQKGHINCWKNDSAMKLPRWSVEHYPACVLAFCFSLKSDSADAGAFVPPNWLQALVDKPRFEKASSWNKLTLLKLDVCKQLLRGLWQNTKKEAVSFRPAQSGAKPHSRIPCHVPYLHMMASLLSH